MLRLSMLLFALLSASIAAAQNRLLNPPYTVDGLRMIEGAAQLLQGASVSNVQATKDGSGVELSQGALTGSLAFEVQTEFPFNEALPSWNGWAPKDGGFRIWMAVPGGGLAGWFEAGSWGHLADETTTRVFHLANGMYDIDTLLLNQPVQSVQVRIDLVRASPSTPSPTIRMFTLSYTNSTGNRRLHKQYGRSGNNGTSADVDLRVPYRSQVVEKKPWIGRICAPASVAMVLASYGVNRDTQDMAAKVYDRPSDAFGVWNRSIQGAAQYGVRGYLHRVRNWSEVEKLLKQNAVLCASIRFASGEVQDPLFEKGKRQKGTQGHLVVVKGMTADGNVIVHDTASKDYGVDLRWDKDEFAKAWFDKGGVAYIFTGPADKP